MKAEKITLEEAIEFIRWLEPILAEHKLHCALTGSVLYKGESTKDLDIIVYAHNQSDTPNVDHVEVVNVLTALFSADGGAIYPVNRFYPDDRIVLRTNTGRWTVEFFIFKLAEPSL